MNQFASQICVDSSPVKFETEVRNLGLIIDSELRFSTHISECIRKAFTNIKTIFQNRRVLSSSVKAMLCDSLVLSRFNFCDSVYDPCITAADSARIQRVQNSCLRLIHGIRKYEAISHKLKETNWINMKQRRYLHSVTLFHKVIQNRTPPYLYDKITFRTDVHHINIRRKHAISVPRHFTALFQRSFSYNIANLMNRFMKQLSLPPSKFRKFILNNLIE